MNISTNPNSKAPNPEPNPTDLTKATHATHATRYSSYCTNLKQSSQLSAVQVHLCVV